MYQNVLGKIPDQHVPRKTWYILVCTKTNLVHTGMYQYVREKNKIEAVHDDAIRTKDLMHTILRDIPLRYQREIIGDVNG
jgi:hypothetical protein